MEERKADLKKAESGIYEALGVRQFRKLVLSFEALKHRKDGSRNENYHIRDLSAASLESFTGYLLYNALLHVISLLFAAVYFLVSFISGTHFVVIDVFMVLLIIFNLCCIMLQRYIYLKITIHNDRVKKRNEKLLEKAVSDITAVLNDKPQNELTQEYRMILKMKDSIETGSDCFFDDASTAVLERLSAIVSSSVMHRSSSEKEETEPLSMNTVISDISRKTAVYGTLERRVSKLQTFFGQKKSNNVLFHYSFITESRECDEALCSLFPSRTRETLEWTVMALMKAYQQKGFVS